MRVSEDFGTWPPVGDCLMMIQEGGMMTCDENVVKVEGRDLELLVGDDPTVVLRGGQFLMSEIPLSG